MASEPELLAYLLLGKAYYNFAVYYGGGGRLGVHLDQLLQRFWIRLDVLFGELDTFLGQKLCLLVTGASTRLRVDDCFVIAHLYLLFSDFANVSIWVGYTYRMATEKKRGKGRRRYLGVWDPTGGAEREGSGLPVEVGEEKVRIFYRDPSGDTEEIPVNELDAALSEEGGVVWIDLIRPRTVAEGILRDTLEFPPLTVEDCTAPLRMPKMDAFEVKERSDVFVAVFAVRVEREESLGLLAVEVDLVVGPNYLVTVRDGPLPEISGSVRECLRSGDLGEEPGGMLAYYVLDGLIDGHLPGLVEIATAAEELEFSLDPGEERASVAALENLIALRRDLSAFRRLAIAQQEILRRVGRTSRSLRGSFSDVADNQREAVDMADATRDYVEGAVEAYRLRRDERSGLGIRRLTVFAAILGPLSLLSGIYGTNFRQLPGSDGPLAFWIFIAVQVVFVAAAVVFLGKRGLL